MQIEPFSFLTSPLESPLYALILVGLGVLFRVAGKSNLLIGSNPDYVRWDARNNGLFFLFAGRSATVAEQRIWLPDRRFLIQRYCGHLQQWIGWAVVSFGLACLAISLLQIF